MENTLLENNQVEICGEIVSDFFYNHEVFGEAFHLVYVKVERLSGTEDIIPVMVSERLIDVTSRCEGQPIRISGQYRSYNRHEGNRSHLMLFVFAREIEYTDNRILGPQSNSIYLEGYICKEPVYRETPLGREIADLLIAVNRPYGMSDYIPCICWGRNARFANSLAVGSRCAVWGRVQSREYVKRISDTEVEKRIAYEVSVSRLGLREQIMEV